MSPAPLSSSHEEEEEEEEEEEVVEEEEDVYRAKRQQRKTAWGGLSVGSDSAKRDAIGRCRGDVEIFGFWPYGGSVQKERMTLVIWVGAGSVET
ncbi:hypothetical protein NL676_023557 [Syzygium grande]|nr:hypothetical protein NL676_023557 [Syzygium grande]